MVDYFLFTNPTLISEMGRVLDLGSTMNEYNSTLSPQDADYLAIKSDWEIVGADISEAISSHGKKETKTDK
jgi:hypothetical protein